MDEVWIGRPGDGLSLRADDRDGHNAVTSAGAILQVPGLEAHRVVVHHYANGFGDLLHFFDGMARDWKGWDGARVFESLEHDLTLTATHDGHIRLVVRLRESTVPDGWDVTVRLGLDPGEQLTDIASGLHVVLGQRL
jgi:hypothetical protein